MNVAKAFANNDVVLLLWHYDKIIKNCLGFCIKRKDVNNNKEFTLFSMIGFKKDSIQKRSFKSTGEWPIQKFNWRDFTAKNGETYEYSIIPMTGTSKHLKPKTGAMLVTNKVTLSSGTGKIKAYFNRGILATQYVSSLVPKSKSGKPNYKILTERIMQPGDKLRNQLADELIDALKSLLDKSIKEGGKCYCALYELNDTELIEKLLLAKGKVHIILSNTGTDDKTNEASRASLHQSGVDIIDRMVATNHIGHNKFILYVNKLGQPTTVVTGSTNWTYTGLCAQSNNAIVIESNTLAAYYLDYWKRMKADKAKQGAKFRKDNDHLRSTKIGSTDISLWFSPNTKAKSKTKSSPIPPDLAEVFQGMESAKHSILFLVFMPGKPGIIEKAAEIQTNKPDLFIRGAATDLKAVESSDVTLFHRGITEPVIVGAQEIKDDFSYWAAELLKSSPMAHAVIHDKVMVIDAFTENCIVVTGSHNLGSRASYNNDENLLIIRGNQELATSYATHILDVYDHYRWRYYLVVP